MATTSGRWGSWALSTDDDDEDLAPLDWPEYTSLHLKREKEEEEAKLKLLWPPPKHPSMSASGEEGTLEEKVAEKRRTEEEEKEEVEEELTISEAVDSLLGLVVEMHLWRDEEPSKADKRRAEGDEGCTSPTCVLSEPSSLDSSPPMSPRSVPQQTGDLLAAAKAGVLAFQCQLINKSDSTVSKQRAHRERIQFWPNRQAAPSAPQPSRLQQSQARRSQARRPAPQMGPAALVRSALAAAEHSAAHGRIGRSPHRRPVDSASTAERASAAQRRKADPRPTADDRRASGGKNSKQRQSSAPVDSMPAVPELPPGLSAPHCNVYQPAASAPARRGRNASPTARQAGSVRGLQLALRATVADRGCAPPRSTQQPGRRGGRASQSSGPPSVRRADSPAQQLKQKARGSRAAMQLPTECTAACSREAADAPTAAAEVQQQQPAATQTTVSEEGSAQVELAQPSLSDAAQQEEQQAVSCTKAATEECSSAPAQPEPELPPREATAAAASPDQARRPVADSAAEGALQTGASDQPQCSNEPAHKFPFPPHTHSVSLQRLFDSLDRASGTASKPRQQYSDLTRAAGHDSLRGASAQKADLGLLPWNARSLMPEAASVAASSRSCRPPRAPTTDLFTAERRLQAGNLKVPQPAARITSAGSAADAIASYAQPRAAPISTHGAASGACPQPKKKKSLLQKVGWVAEQFIYSLCIYPRQWDGSVATPWVKWR